MRALFLLLILLNLAFFYWLYQQEQADSAMSIATPRPASDTLLLLSEFENTDELEQSHTDTTAPQNNPKKEGVLAQPEDKTPPTAPRPSTFACYTIGPISEPDAAHDLAAVFTALGVQQSQQRNETTETVAGYWVYLPPLPSRNSAREELKQLKEKGIEGSGLIFSGKYRNAISLGMFSNKSFATRQQARAEKLGYTALINKRMRSNSAYWLDYREATEKSIVEPIWPEVLKDFPGLEKHAVPCD